MYVYMGVCVCIYLYIYIVCVCIQANSSIDRKVDRYRQNAVYQGPGFFLIGTPDTS